MIAKEISLKAVTVSGIKIDRSQLVDDCLT
jgi:hypothetical protein